MPKIQCIQYASTKVDGQTYVFNRDAKGRFVAEVHIPEHVKILIGLVGVYSLVKDDEPAQEPEAPVKALVKAMTKTAAPEPLPVPVETPAPAPVPAETPAPQAPASAPAASEAPPAPADDLTVLKGIGKAMSAKLAAMGITTYAHLAALDETGQAKVDDALNKTGAIYRDEWVKQAAALVATPVE